MLLPASPFPMCSADNGTHMTQSRIPFTPVLANLPASVPFVGPETLVRQRGRPFRMRLGANESPFGCSPSAHEAMREAITDIGFYADPEGFELRAALAHEHGIGLDEVCLGAGIDELLGLLVRTLVQPETPVVTSLGAYPTFNYHVEGFGGVLTKVPYRNDCIDLDALASAVHETRAPLVYLANPDNPMGTWHSAQAVSRFLDALPERCLLILDEAYIEFAPASAQLPIDTTNPRIIRMRTFSKAHGMAGARIGYAVACEETIQALNKIRNHFGINRVAQAGALASLNDRRFLDATVSDVRQGREEYAALAKRLGLTTVPSATNFVAMDVGDSQRARALLQALLDRDIFVRMPSVSPLDRCVRITVGTPQQRNLLATILQDALATVDETLSPS